MHSETWFGRIRSLDLRLLASIAATIMLVAGVMWVVPTTPNSNSFVFESDRRGLANARPIDLGKPRQGSIVDGSDADFYRIGPLQSASEMDVLMTNGSAKMIPGLRIFDGERGLLQDKTAEYLKKPGADIESSFKAEPNRTYYVQVFTQRNTTGTYTLTMTPRQP
jgi:hypothetical protein